MKRQPVKMLVKVGRRAVRGHKSNAVSAVATVVLRGAARPVLWAKAAVRTSAKWLAITLVQRQPHVVQEQPMWRLVPKTPTVVLFGRKPLVRQGRSAKTTLVRALAKTLVRRQPHVARVHRSNVAKKAVVVAMNGRPVLVRAVKAVKETLVKPPAPTPAKAEPHAALPMISNPVRPMPRAV